MPDRKGKAIPDIGSLLNGIPDPSSPPVHIAVETEGPADSQQLTTAIIAALSGKEGGDMPPKMKVKTLDHSGTVPGHVHAFDREDVALHRDSPAVSDHDLWRIAHHGKADREEETYISPDPVVPDCEKYSNIDRDPFEQRKFAESLLKRQGELLEICWTMREKLEAAREYVSGIPAWLTLIEQGIAMTADCQKIADGIREIGEFERKHANYLIDQMDQFNK